MFVAIKLRVMDDGARVPNRPLELPSPQRAVPAAPAPHLASPPCVCTLSF